MSLWGRNGHGTGEGEPLDDATVEDLLTGAYAGDAPDLVAASRFFDQVRSVADRPVPPPSAALAQILTDSVHAGAEDPTPRRRWRWDLPVGHRGRRADGFRRASAARHRSREIQLAPVATAVCVLLVVAVLAAGSARLLPGPTQELVAKIVQTVTPFDFPEERESKAVLSRAPTAEPPAPPHDPTPRGHGDSSLGPAAESGTNQSGPVGREDSRSQPGGATNLPAPPTTLAPRAPTVPEGKAPSSGAIAGADRPPPARHSGLSAELRGATGADTAGDADGHARALVDANPGRDELCLTLTASGIAPVTSVHLHAGVIGASGPVVAAFAKLSAPRTCITVTDQLIKRIRKEPGNFYVDVHTIEFPNGALRGQLTR